MAAGTGSDLTSRAVLVLLALAAALLLWRSPRSASDLAVVPDSVEYAVGAVRVAGGGDYRITVGGTAYPPRYPPWFSLLVLAPVYRSLGMEVGNGIVAVTASALGCVLLAFKFGQRLSGIWGGTLAVLFLLVPPLFRSLGREILTDVPACLLVLGAAHLVCVRDVSRPPAVLAAGLVIALAGGLRPVCLALLLPALAALRGERGLRARVPLAVLLLLPAAILAAATWWYQHAAFGDGLRSGYQFWCPVPYDYPSLVFSLRFVGGNLAALAASPFPPLLAVALGAAWLARRRGDLPAPADEGLAPALARFGLLGTGPAVLLHLVYFFPDPRFFLPSVVLLAVLAGGLLGRLFRRHHPVVCVGAAAALLAAGVLVAQRHAREPALRRDAVDVATSLVPPDALLVSGLDPAYAEFMLGTGRAAPRHLPVSREVEYASKLIRRTPALRPEPPPANWRDHRCAGLRTDGFVDPVERVLAEDPGLLTDWLRGGRRAFVLAVGLRPADEAALAALLPAVAFVAAEPGGRLYEARLTGAPAR